MKICTKCKIEKDDASFYIHHIKNKIVRRQPCKDCHKLNSSQLYIKSRKWQEKKRRYGISKQEYERFVEKQKGLCAICLNPFDNLDVDHCHTTSKVRGLLCQKCNKGIGLLQENIVIIENAKRYLLK